VARETFVPTLAAGSNTEAPTLPSLEPAILRANLLLRTVPASREPRIISAAVSGIVVRAAFLRVSSYAYFAYSQVPPALITSSSAYNATELASYPAPTTAPNALPTLAPIAVAPGTGTKNPAAAPPAVPNAYAIIPSAVPPNWSIFLKKESSSTRFWCAYL